MPANLISIHLASLPVVALCVYLLAGRPAVAFESETAQDSAPAFAEKLEQAISVLTAHGLEFDPEQGYATILEALVHQIDAGSVILSDEEAARLTTRRSGQVHDIGIQLAITNESIRVAHIPDDSPARDAGLAVGDKLLKVGDTDVTSLGLYRVLGLLQSETAKPVKLTVESADQTVVTQRIDRLEMMLSDIESSEALPFQLAYLKINRLHEGTGEAVRHTLAGWADEARYGIVLDLRGADGEDLDSVRVIAEQFAEPGALLYAYRDRDDQDILISRADQAGSLGLPVMVLIDGKTGGAAEVLAAVLSDSARGAMLFGQVSRGDLLVREPVALPDGTRIHLATRRLITGNGNVYNGLTGVRPDVLSTRPDEDTAMYKPVRSGRTQLLDEELEQERLYHRSRGDATLRRALDVLLGLKALDIRPRASSPHHSP